MELVDTLDLKSNDHRGRAGSSPASGTKPLDYSRGFFVNHYIATVYILYSKSIDKFYAGSCNDLQKRLVQHSSKEFDNSYTRQVTDWVLYFAIDNLNYQQARKIEKHIKSMKSREYFQNLRKYPKMVDKLINKYS